MEHLTRVYFVPTSVQQIQSQTELHNKMFTLILQGAAAFLDA